MQMHKLRVPLAMVQRLLWSRGTKQRKDRNEKAIRAQPKMEIASLEKKKNGVEERGCF